MTILGFDFSSTRKSVAVIEVTGDGTIAKSASASEHAERTTRPAALSAQVLEESGIARESIDRIAIGLGPGSLMGIRIGIAFAIGLRLANGASLVGIRSVDAIAHSEHKRGFRGTLAVAIDTKRAEHACCEYVIDNAGPQPRTDLVVVRNELLGEFSKKVDRLVGPGIKAVVPEAFDMWPDALTICQLAATCEPATSPLEPIVLRPNVFVKAPKPRRIP